MNLSQESVEFQWSIKKWFGDKVGDFTVIKVEKMNNYSKEELQEKKPFVFKTL